jgi:hypothetical protein
MVFHIIAIGRKSSAQRYKKRFKYVRFFVKMILESPLIVVYKYMIMVRIEKNSTHFKDIDGKNKTVIAAGVRMNPMSFIVKK